MKNSKISKKSTIKHMPSKMSVTSIMPKAKYENDFYKWTQNQIIVLKKGDFDKLDNEWRSTFGKK